MVFSFRKISPNSIGKFFPFDPWKAIVRLLFYRDVALNHFSLFAQHLLKKSEAPSTVFELILFSFSVEDVLLFEDCPSF